jgi:hypothetical protein
MSELTIQSTPSDFFVCFSKGKHGSQHKRVLKNLVASASVIADAFGNIILDISTGSASFAYAVVVVDNPPVLISTLDFDRDNDVEVDSDVGTDELATALRRFACFVPVPEANRPPGPRLWQ